MPIKKRTDTAVYKGERRCSKYLMKCYNKKDAFHYFYKSNNIGKGQKHKLAIGNKKYTKIMDMYNLALVEIIKTGVAVKLPYTLGELQLKKKKIDVEVIKFAKPESKIKRSLDNYVYKGVIRWVKRFIMVKNKSYYSFTQARHITDDVQSAFDKGFYKQILDI